MDTIALFPLVAAAAFKMDCSGGNIYPTAAKLERAMSALPVEWLRAAETELAGLTGDQLEYFALGGPQSGEPFTGRGGALGLEVLHTANAVLERLYNA